MTPRSTVFCKGSMVNSLNLLFQKISLSPILRIVFPRTFMGGPTTSSGRFSVVFLFTVSPHIPPGRSRLLTHMANAQFAMSHSSSVHLHHTPSSRDTAAFFPHLNNLHFGEHFFFSTNTSTTFDDLLTKFRNHLSKNYVHKSGYKLFPLFQLSFSVNYYVSFCTSPLKEPQ